MANTVPETYQDRGPAFVKHTLLELYLETLVLTIGMGTKGDALFRKGTTTSDDVTSWQ